MFQTKTDTMRYKEGGMKNVLVNLIATAFRPKHISHY